MGVHSAPVARRTQAQRSEEMRARLAAAAFETIAVGGLGALKLRAVSQLAGVSQGALLHHFPDKNAVTLAAIEHALSLARAERAPWVDAEAPSPEAVLRAMLAEFRAFFYSDRFWVAIGITMEASKDPAMLPAIRRCVASLRTPTYQTWADRLVAVGWQATAAMVAVRSGAALMSGMAIRRFWTDDDALTARIEEDWIARYMRG